MRRPFLLAVGLSLASCNGSGPSAEKVAAEANLLDAATVNAILGANIPPEELASGNDLQADAGAENGSIAVGNQAD